MIETDHKATESKHWNVKSANVVVRRLVILLFIGCLKERDGSLFKFVCMLQNWLVKQEY